MRQRIARSTTRRWLARATHTEVARFVGIKTAASFRGRVAEARRLLAGREPQAPMGAVYAR